MKNNKENKENVKPILARIIKTSKKRLGFTIKKIYFNDSGLKRGQEIEAILPNDVPPFLTIITPIGRNSDGVVFSRKFTRRYGIKSTKEEIEILLNLTDPKQLNIHKKKAARTSPAEIIQTSEKECGDPNGIQVST